MIDLEDEEKEIIQALERIYNKLNKIEKTLDKIDEASNFLDIGLLTLKISNDTPISMSDMNSCTMYYLKEYENSNIIWVNSVDYLKNN